MPEFLETASMAIALAMEEDRELISWQMTHPLYAHEVAGSYAEAKKVYIGNRAPEQFHQLPIDIVPGPTHEWQLLCKGGRYQAKPMSGIEWVSHNAD